MKTKEELNALKEEVETLNKKLAELSEEELEQVTGGLKFYGPQPAELSGVSPAGTINLLDGVTVQPSKSSNAGGVATSGLET